ncbi:tRNA pseudouridine(55) synthase TruB [Chloroflexota bacterium]
MDGILNINKPSGRTSFSVVSQIRKLSRERRVGHAGTLDPAATGVLPVCLGQGTRVTEFLMDTTKVYRAEIEMGVATDTYDASGQVTRTGDPSGISQEQLELSLASFRGVIVQTPPMYSAVKYHGKPLYKLARAGIEVTRKSRPAKIHFLELTGWQPPLVTMEIVCGKGTYVRSLAHDLGEILGCGAHLKNLVRQRCGPFYIKDAITLPQLEDAFHYGYWRRLVHPPDFVLSHWAAMVVNDADEQAIRNGRPLTLDSSAAEIDHPRHQEEGRCRAYTPDGCFLGVLRFDTEKGQWQPEKVFL